MSTSCSPESGTALPIGTTPGRCTATDTLGQTVSCSFLVQVLPAAQISKTKFMAFGDSLTAGVTSSALTLLLEPGMSYPFKLQEKLARKYPTQTIEVVNAGLPGEKATDGVSRLGTQINAVRPEVVLIMEGTNDALSQGYSVSATSAALDSMVDDVFSRDAEAMIATVPPVRPGSPVGEGPSNAQDLNGVIRAIAFSNECRWSTCTGQWLQGRVRVSRRSASPVFAVVCRSLSIFLASVMTTSIRPPRATR